MWTVNDVLIDPYPFIILVDPHPFRAIKGYGSTEMIKGYGSTKTSLTVHAVSKPFSSTCSPIFCCLSTRGPNASSRFWGFFTFWTILAYCVPCPQGRYQKNSLQLLISWLKWTLCQMCRLKLQNYNFVNLRLLKMVHIFGNLLLRCKKSTVLTDGSIFNTCNYNNDHHEAKVFFKSLSQQVHS